MADPPQPSNVTIRYSAGNEVECSYTYFPDLVVAAYFEFVWGTVNDPTDPGNTTLRAQTRQSPRTWIADFFVTPNTTVYIWGKILNQPGSISNVVKYSLEGTPFVSGSVNQPGTPYLVDVNNAGEITVNFQSNQASGTTLLIVYDTNPNRSADSVNIPVSIVTSPDIFGTSPFAVPQGVDVYIWSRATTFASGTFYSSPPMIYNSSTGGGSLTTPLLVAEDLVNNEITVNFQTFPIYGVEQTFSIVYNTENNPGAPGERTNTAFNVSDDLWGSGPFEVEPDTDIYIWAKSQFNGTTIYSDIPLVYNTDTSGIPPSGPSTTPILLSATNSDLTVSFSTAGITGTAPIDVICGASTSATGPFNLTCQVTGTPPLYRATIENLESNKTYYFQTVVFNATLPNQPSAVSAGFTTTNLARVNTPIANLVQATQITMVFDMPVAFFNAAQKAATLRWGTANTPNPLPNSVPAAYLGIVNGNPTWEATVYNLTPGATYFFQGSYAGVANSLLNAVATQQGNAFDLGYMPPRGWATPNPVIVNGISLPWRQT